MKELIGTMAILLTFVGYAPYVRDVLKKKTHPHAYSWLIWAFITILVFALQLSDHAGPGAYVTLGAGSVSLVIFMLSLRFGREDITRTDTVFFILALAAIGIWLFGKQPGLSITLLVTIDMLGFAPTIRKSWHKPYSETLAMYQVGAFRHVLSIFALTHYTFITLLFPTAWICANLTFSIMLIIRRHQLLSNP